jgi:uncharacterized membrane protein YkvA (DUF1232 family)
MSWRDTAARLKREVYSLYFAVRDPRVPWYAKALAGSIVAYAFSPIDLIPDFIPVLGYLDDLILIPLGVLLVRRLIPADVLADCRGRAAALDAKPQSWGGAAIVVGIWLVLAGLGVLLAVRWFS